MAPVKILQKSIGAHRSSPASKYRPLNTIATDTMNSRSFRMFNSHTPWSEDAAIAAGGSDTRSGCRQEGLFRNPTATTADATLKAGSKDEQINDHHGLDQEQEQDQEQSQDQGQEQEIADQRCDPALLRLPF
jgi:hypothetical protein